MFDFLADGLSDIGAFFGRPYRLRVPMEFAAACGAQLGDCVASCRNQLPGSNGSLPTPLDETGWAFNANGYVASPHFSHRAGLMRPLTYLRTYLRAHDPVPSSLADFGRTLALPRSGG